MKLSILEEGGKYTSASSSDSTKVLVILSLTDQWVIYKEDSKDITREDTISRVAAENSWTKVLPRKPFIVHEAVDREGVVFLCTTEGILFQFGEDEPLSNNKIPHKKLGRSWKYDPETDELIRELGSLADFVVPTLPGLYEPNPNYPHPGFNPGEITCNSAEVKS